MEVNGGFHEEPIYSLLKGRHRRYLTYLEGGMGNVHR